MSVIEVRAERERLDRLARAGLGSERSGGIEALLAANPGLAAAGPFQALGARLRLPETVVPPERPDAPTRPWE
ncbi:tail protein X [Methylopila sp. M107]|uniref:tail protein X n=1 Tax=Methylopila sp. M107 TaxID=1101190 RepID=UPI000374D93D|nr:tail protein X [Methylopila sp. M107]